MAINNKFSKSNFIKITSELELIFIQKS